MSGNSSATDHPAAPPLAGCRVVVTRAPEQARPLVARLEELGAVPLPCPAIRIEPPDDPAPLDEALRRIDRYDWVAFTSANAVRAVGARLAWLGLPRSALGPARLAAAAVVGPMQTTAGRAAWARRSPGERPAAARPSTKYCAAEGLAKRIASTRPAAMICP
ncbi:MAG TPA: uroporphyrinogen-III synthase, partial [Gemmatimonadales bacterium]|nr:uroporphyrinogen-III synthase [Gemmatimonadales bacterium]